VPARLPACVTTPGFDVANREFLSRSSSAW